MTKDRQFLTAAISRNGQTIIPRGDEHFEVNDQVYIIGESKQMPRVFALAGFDEFKLRRVMIAGGSREAIYLAQLLEDHDVDCTIIEAERPRCVQLAEQLQKTLILHGNATDTELLEMEGIQEVQGFVAFTGSDDTNMLSSLLAKTHGVPKVVSRLQRIEYIPLVSRVGIDAAVSPRLSTVNTILRYVRRGVVLSVAALRGIDAEVIEFRVRPGSALAGRTLADIHFPKQSLVGTITRGDQVIVASGNVVLGQGDKVAVLALPEAVSAVERLFA